MQARFWRSAVFLVLSVSLVLSLGVVRVRAEDGQLVVDDLNQYYDDFYQLVEIATTKYTRDIAAYRFDKAGYWRDGLDAYITDHGKTVRYEVWMIRGNDDVIEDPVYYYTRPMGFDPADYPGYFSNLRHCSWQRWEHEADGSWTYRGQFTPDPWENEVLIGEMTLTIPDRDIPRYEPDPAVLEEMTEYVRRWHAEVYPDRAGVAFLDTERQYLLVVLKKDDQEKESDFDTHMAIGIQMERQGRSGYTEYYGSGYKESDLLLLAKHAARSDSMVVLEAEQ